MIPDDNYDLNIAIRPLNCFNCDSVSFLIPLPIYDNSIHSDAYMCLECAKSPFIMEHYLWKLYFEFGYEKVRQVLNMLNLHDEMQNEEINEIDDDIDENSVDGEFHQMMIIDGRNHPVVGN